MALDTEEARRRIQAFDFGSLFIDQLGWSRPRGMQDARMALGDGSYTRTPIAQLAGVVVFEVTSNDGRIPDSKARASLYKEISAQHHECLLIFVDETRSQSLWYWMKRQDGKAHPRDHIYVRGQPGDLFLSKLSSMVFEIGDFDESGNVSIVEVADRLRKALDVERVTKKFYREFQDQHFAFLDLIRGIPDEKQRRWYASVLLNRLMFIYFLQSKFFLDGGNTKYLQDKLSQSRAQGPDLYYRVFLKTLFFEGFGKPEGQRSPEVSKRLGQIEYLDGGLFLPHQVEEIHPEIDVPDRAFQSLYSLFESYSWNLNDTPGGNDREINPDVLGYIFEKYINQKTFGAYYTRPQLTNYLCEQTIHPLVLREVNALTGPGDRPRKQYESIADLLLGLDAPLCRSLLFEILPRLSILDPACGSGAFLVAAMKSLINIYSAVLGKIHFLGDPELSVWHARVKGEHSSLSYFIKKSIITDNLFGVDVMEEAIEICKLRLFLALVASAENSDQLEPLPNIDFNILAGNSLVGLMRVRAKDFDRRSSVQGNLFRRSYAEVVQEKDRLIEQYRHTHSSPVELMALRNQIQGIKLAAQSTLNEILLEEFYGMNVKYEEATWDREKGELGKPRKRALKEPDIRQLRPFHWGYEFDEVLNTRGGFDIIITNPPWEVFKPNEREFFEGHSDLIRRKMDTKDFEREKEILLQDRDRRESWLAYLSQFPHASLYFRLAPQFRNQSSIVKGKKTGTDINLYKLFVEQCFNLLRDGGRCGIIAPGGIYTDLGSKQLREMLFEGTRIETILGLSNERFIFEQVDHRVKFAILVFEKGRSTDSFKASFRINPREAVAPDELEEFLDDEAYRFPIKVSSIKRLSSTSLSIMEFRNSTDLNIAEKVYRFPVLGNPEEGWGLVLCNEFHMTKHRGMFKDKPAPGRLPLVEGKMIHQFSHLWGKPRHWLEEQEARKELIRIRMRHIEALANKENIRVEVDPNELRLDYETFRLGFRDVARGTDERTLISTVLPPKVFCPHTISLERVYDDVIEDGSVVINRTLVSSPERLYLCGVLNSYVIDYLIRQNVTAHVSFFIVQNLPVPRLREGDPYFEPIVRRVARLICTAPEYDDLARAVGLSVEIHGATAVPERSRLRAELDALVAHLYEIEEDDYQYILSSFPVVPDPVKVAAHNAYRSVARGLIR